MATVQQQIEALEKKLAQAKERARKMDAQKKVAEAKKARSEDARRKILVGGAVLSLVKSGSWAEADVRRLLNDQIKNEKDRAFLGLSEEGQLLDLPAIKEKQ